jgi:hypothetical protein
MNANSDTAKRRVLAAFLALFALVALAVAIARARPTVTTAQSQQPTVAVVKLPGGGTRTVLIRPAHATTQTSGGGRTQLVSKVGPGGKIVSVPAGRGGDR